MADAELRKKSTRKAFGEHIVLIGDRDSKVVVLDADLSKSTFSMHFAKKYPERFFQMGIAEANMIGTASGMALCGLKPFACSFACFITGRFDQIKMSMAYSGAPVRLIGTHAGIGIGEDGYSQQGLEDIALMRSLPTMLVLQPADDIETASMMDFLLLSKDPAYLRLTRQDLITVHSDDHRFQIGVYPLLKNGDDVAIFATGGCVYNALSAAKELQKSGINARVYNASSIKPIDNKALYEAASKTKIIFSIEDHQIHGGLSGALAESLCFMPKRPRLISIGIMDEFGESGSPDELYEKHGLSIGRIVTRIKKEMAL